MKMQVKKLTALFGIVLVFKYRYMMNIRFLFFVACIFFLQRGYGHTKLDVPIIRLCPEEATTLKMSELFDSYRVLMLKDCFYRDVKNLLELDDRFIALLEIGMADCFIAEFDKSGNFKRKIGSKADAGNYPCIWKILLEPDGSLGAYASHQDYLNYSLGGRLNDHWVIKYEKDYLKLQSCDGRVGDNLYLLRVCPRRSDKDYSCDYWLNIITGSGEVVQQFFPLKDMQESAQSPPYHYEGSIRLYNVYDNYVYSVKGDCIMPCYYLDKGKHTKPLDSELWLVNREKAENEAGVHDVRINENGKYVIGSYSFQERYYYFVYDKTTGKTFNYISINDDLLFPLSSQIRYFPSVYFCGWSDLHFDDHYFNFYYSPRDFADKIEQLKERLSPTAWDEFCRKHPDVIKKYKERDDEAFVIISYKFR